MSRILFTGGGSASLHAGITPSQEQTPQTPTHQAPLPGPAPPPGNRPPGTRHPLGADPPRTRQPPESRPPRPGTPPGPGTPLGSRPTRRRPPLGAEYAGRYGQRAAGTHPTGMQSCFFDLCRCSV